MNQMEALAPHPSLKEIAYDLVRRKIVNHEFEPGSRIREDLLASELSMSRTPVREAINRLVAEGLTEVSEINAAMSHEPVSCVGLDSCRV